MERKWIFPEGGDEQLVKELAVSLEVTPLVARLLLVRGIKNADEARLFLDPQMSDCHDPFTMKGMDVIVDRLERALREKERIMIYGDYDVDGITGTALLWRSLSYLGGDVNWYLPSRAKEGYGISSSGVEEAQRRGVKLIVSVDCGITAHQEVELARSLGIECIITDHHEPKESLPDAVAVLDPKRPDCSYQFKELAGVGVAYKMLQGLYRHLGLDEAQLQENLDLVALGTLADIVPLTGENRVLAKYGLEKIRSSSKPGIRALLEVTGLTGKPLDSGQIVFMLAPRINAAGRIGEADSALRLLITENQDEAFAIARTLDQENRKRKEIDDRILADAVSMVKQRVDLDQVMVIVLESENWHQGVIGIVASRLVEQFYRPTILIAVDGEKGKGSARSIAAFHLHEALKGCQEHLLGFGGHKYAAGMSIETAKIPEFRQKMNQIAKQTLTSDDLMPTQALDVLVDLDEVDSNTARSFAKFAPFGPGNRHPVLASQQLRVVGSPYIVGKNHLKFKVKQKQRVFDAIGFSFGDLLDEVEDPDATLDMAFVLEENEWQGQKKLQLRLKDIKVR
ncbi:MAG: single-stranded-DNA-specific exonuclease RecJ [Candidatus Edwardsbacteria bacterium RIFOXYD12_FULL_50_11]|uniref:Single-stranded-DNA-specific exonuclease RecJ n=1 Tax=Candidatus Edwardsbacteria bacterium GWF2_54_11 TaxID=1817851 RepID=A0A1F5R7P5_9BACT|nr:MAG: single-stranded-DNA-specific exonuclease RecJ [Candidatus Edwardsbacteria bacterium RifOxyC12_full_54_24]OGF07817.1 MAG: single-stranded-DNA-specific exonuclease RecJ [Candidatus Edwardsbacteria bacterium RifOxyA12_full_54_48]OGF10066.1 MAG: single-stranded-DNA-specific exonuclease RecJ [Candidatus Edwardsbacteria bacterium GWE2_54_12]OGF10467.1 MAG: single-stranded-DNA-specific exonuclease RecJ [Candidatus Edwardsbacteria bacterium GWF2_54_11]OGF14978.1 MAG: single-stranded-DNA-specifi